MSPLLDTHRDALPEQDLPRSSSRESLLSEAELVRVALQIVRRKGAAGLTMRDLAEELQVSPMAAYYYVDSKDHLLRLVATHVWGSVQVPPPDAGPWYERLRSAMLAEREATAAYHGLYEAVMRHGVEPMRALEDGIFDLILDAGYPPARALTAFRTLMSWSHGFAAIESTLRDPKRRRPSGWGKAQRVAHDREQVPELPVEIYFTSGLDAVITGLRAMLDS